MKGHVTHLCVFTSLPNLGLVCVADLRLLTETDKNERMSLLKPGSWRLELQPVLRWKTSHEKKLLNRFPTRTEAPGGSSGGSSGGSPGEEPPN